MSKHVVKFEVTVYMSNMTGSAEQSAEIADDQVSFALVGKESGYGLPETVIIRVVDYHAAPEPEDDTCHGYDTTRDYELDNPPEPPEGWDD